MRNWSTDTTRFKKDKAQYEKWRLEQLINWGLDGEKLDRRALMRRFNELDIDPAKKRFLSLLLWGR
jgi:hypothetical protein